MRFSFLLSLFLMPQLFISHPSWALDQKAASSESPFLLESEKNTIEIFKKASPLVVSVDSTRQAASFLSRSLEEVPAGSGTGFIWDKAGHVITNFHVIQAALSTATKVWVTGKDGKRLAAEIVGSEPRKDIAVLRVKGLSSQAGFADRLADTEKLQVGQKVLAIGNPFGFEQTLTTGIISALDRSMPSLLGSITIRNMIQTDASINPGNSGGPLLDSRGYLTGMNTAIISGSGSSAGIGFAVPANTIRRIADQIIKYGEVRQPGLGITGLVGHDKMMLARYGFKIPVGVVIRDVQPGSPADKAGLQGIKQHPRRGIVLGDIITGIDGKKIESFDDLYNLVSEKKPGDLVQVEIKRQGKVLNKKIRLAILNMQS